MLTLLYVLEGREMGMKKEFTITIIIRVLLLILMAVLSIM